MAIGAKHVLLVAVVTLLLTYTVYHGKSSHGDTVAMQGRKSLPDPQFSETTPTLAEDSVTATESDATDVATFETVEGDALTPTSLELEETSKEATEEVAELVSEEVSVEASEEPAVEETVETTTEETTTEEFTAEEGNAEDVQAVEDVDFVEGAQEGSEEASEGQQVREMLDAAMAPLALPPPLVDTAAAPAPDTTVQNPDRSNYPKPKVDNPNIFLTEVFYDNMAHRQNEGFIQSCIKADGCGTPDP